MNEGPSLETTAPGAPPRTLPGARVAVAAQRLAGRTGSVLLWAGALAVLLLEWLTTGLEADVGLALFAVLFVALLAASRATLRLGEALVALALVALARIVDLVMPLFGATPFQHLLVIQGMVLLSTVAMVRLYLRPLVGRPRLAHLLFAPLAVLVGGGLGAVAYLILRLPPVGLDAGALAPAFLAPSGLGWPIAALTVSALADELLFRGFLLGATAPLLGAPQALALNAVLYAGLHLGWASWPLMGLMFVASLVFGAATLASRSTLGAMLAHVILNLTLFLVLPGLAV